MNEQAMDSSAAISSEPSNSQVAGTETSNGAENTNKASVDSGVETSNDSNDSGAAQNESNTPPALFDINWIDTLLYYRALPSDEKLTPLAESKDKKSETRCTIETIDQPGSSLSTDVSDTACKPSLFSSRCNKIPVNTFRLSKQARTQEFLTICSNLSATLDYSAVNMMKAHMRHKYHRRQPYSHKPKEKPRTSGDEWPYYNWARSATLIKAREAKLFFAVTTNNVERVRRLLIMSVSPNCVDKAGCTPLHIAAHWGFPEVVSVLLKHGADAHCYDRAGETPLHVAVSAGHASVVSILLASGCSPLATDQLGYNALDVAKMRLRLLQYCKREDTASIKVEASKVVSVLLACLKNRRGYQQQVEVLSNICSRLSLTSTPNEVQGEIRDLLSKIGELHLEC